MKKLFLVVALSLLLGCYWTPWGASTLFGYYRDGQWMTAEEAEEYAEENGRLGEEDTEVIIIIEWP